MLFLIELQTNMGKIPLHIYFNDHIVSQVLVFEIKIICVSGFNFYVKHSYIIKLCKDKKGINLVCIKRTPRRNASSNFEKVIPKI